MNKTCGWSKDELVTDVFLWISSHGRAGVVQPSGTYLQQLCMDTGWSQEDLPQGMDDRDE